MASWMRARWMRGRWLRYFLAAIACAAATLCASAQAHVRLEPRVVIEKRLKMFSTDNESREEIVRRWFAESGCANTNLSEQPARVGLPPNVICILPGQTQGVIVVGAHTDHVARGDGVVDNWSGASLLPSLLFSLSGRKRHHTFIFVGFTAEEKGMLGSEYYVAHLTPDERSRIEAMVNMDSLGLTPTKVWASHADKVLLDALASAASASKLPATTANVDNIGSTDSESFARYHIPRVTLHSVTVETLQVLHSADDKLSAIQMDNYYDSYHLIAEYLAYLDDTLKPASAAK